MIGEIWSVYLSHSSKKRHGADCPYLVIDEVDVAEMMSLMKKCRKIYGKIKEDDHVDDIGYTALAASMVLP